MDGIILPDGFESLPAEEPTSETHEEPVEGLETEQVEEPTRESADLEEASQEPKTDLPQTLKIKFDREEREVSVEEAKILAQKGLNYDRAVERAKQEARDAYIAEQNYTWNGKPITTEAEYKQALAEQELINKYKDRDLPEEVIQELMESRRDREERSKEKAAQAEQAKRDAELTDFLGYFQQANGRIFDPNKDTIPAEVWEANKNGVPLRFAYMEHQNKELRSQLKVVKQNEENKKKAPGGSVTAHGSIEVAPEDDFMRGFNSV